MNRPLRWEPQTGWPTSQTKWATNTQSRSWTIWRENKHLHSTCCCHLKHTHTHMHSTYPVVYRLYASRKACQLLTIMTSYSRMMAAWKRTRVLVPLTPLRPWQLQLSLQGRRSSLQPCEGPHPSELSVPPGRSFHQGNWLSIQVGQKTLLDQALVGLLSGLLL